MGKRTSQGSSSSDAQVRKAPRTLFGTLVRVIAIAAGALLIVFLLTGWIYSGQIRDGALKPPTNEPPSLDWEVVSSGNTVSLQASSGADQAGQEGMSGLYFENGYAHTIDLVSSTDGGGTTTDVRSMESGSTPPAVGTDVKVDEYFYRGDPMSALGIEFESVFYASDIGSFPAWYIEGTTDTWAILVHGKGATLEETLRVIPTFHELGYHVMAITYRNDIGTPRDPSGYHQYGVTEWKDLAAAVRYAHDHGAEDHVLYGASMGGAVVTSYLTQSTLRNFTKGAILDSPVLSFEASVDFRASETELPLLPITVPDVVTTFAKWISSWRFDVDWDASNYLAQEKLTNLHAPMLVVHGTEDISIPYATSAQLAEERPDITTLMTTDAGHMRSWNIGPTELQEAITAFLADL
ncbi:MAG: alpha/beta hydrolase [Acidimicrobiia bacterium]